MAKINVLDKHTAELIAAGEVVERPSSVIKELVENSIDSGASAVTVEIKNGGRTFMRVTDNGSGIEKDDIKNAFLRHATSKIKCKDDLNAIYTLGFRGEALASISAVAKVELLTRTHDSEFGNKYVINGGEEIEFCEAGCAVGTTFVVKDLFYNTPARMKFMKKDTTETNVVISMIERIALSHPEISFKVIKDSKQVLNTPGDNLLKSAVFSVFGADFSNSLVEADYELNGIKLNGFITKPTCSRKNRSMQFFFLNGRYIRSKTAIAALEQAYKNQIMTGIYPGCVLNISMNADEIDVNVHPSKIEVRFSDEQRLFSAVYYAVKSGLSADVSRVQFKTDITKLVEKSEGEQLRINIPEKSLNEQKKFIFNTTIKAQENNPIEKTSIEKVGFVSETFSDYAKKEPIKQTDIIFDEPVSKGNNPLENISKEEKIHFKYVGQAFDTYIIVEIDEKIALIDKHAAHERILFEKLKQDATHNPQMLLVPVQIILSAEEYEAILSYIEDINALGFELEDYGSKTILARSVPMELDSSDVKELVLEIAGKLCEKSTDVTPEFLDWLYHSVACRAAIKAGNKSTVEELNSLADVVLNDNNIRYCPHGRPIVAEMSLYEIKKKFSRIV